MLAVTLSYKGTFLPWGNAATSDTPAPNPSSESSQESIKEGCRGGGGVAEERSRANEDEGSCCIHIMYDTQEQKIGMMKGRRTKVKKREG